MTNKFSKSFLKKLPTGVVVTKNENDFVYFIYKIPWKIRKSNIKVSLEEKHYDHAILEPQQYSTLLEPSEMPYYYLELQFNFTKGGSSYKINYGLFFDPYQEEDIDIIKKLVTKRIYFCFYDKNCVFNGSFNGGMDWANKSFLSIEKYAKELRDINQAVTSKQRYSNDVIAYYYRNWKTLNRHYRINSNLKIEYVYSVEDVKLVADNLRFDLPRFINLYFEYRDKTRTKEAIQYFVTRKREGSLTSKGTKLLGFFIEIFKLILDFLEDDLPAKLQSSFYSLSDKFIKELENDRSLSGIFLARTWRFLTVELNEIQSEAEKHVAMYSIFINEVVIHIWSIIFLNFCIKIKINHYFYIDEDGNIHYYKIPAHLFKSFRDLARFLLNLGEQLFCIMGVKGINELMDGNDNYDFSEIYDHLPIIENSEEIFKTMLKSAIKFKEYFITTPSEVLINNKIFRSFIFIDIDKIYCVCKIITFDNKVSYVLINKLGIGVDWTWWFLFDNERRFTVAALCCAVYRDFCVSETRLYERKDIVSRKSTKPKDQIGHKKIIYLPRFKTKYVDDTPVVKDIKDKLEKVIERREHDVSAHLRKVKYSPSDVQLDLAREYGIEVPIGYTFVRPHHRSGISRETVYKSRSALGLLIEASRKSLAEVQEIIQEAEDTHNEELNTAREELKNWKNILNNYEEFELFVNDLINKMGVEAETTQKSYDGGIDIIAMDNRGFTKLKYIIQCKFYDLHNTVGIDKVREILGVKSADSSIDKAILVTSSTFSHESIKFAKLNGIALIDGESLFKMVSGLESKPTV